MFDPTQLLNSLLGAGSQNTAPNAQGVQPGAQQGMGGLLGSLLGQAQSAMGQVSGNVAQAGGIGALASSIFGQATQGVKDAAGQVEQKTGIGSSAEQALRNATGGQGFGDLLNKAKEMMGQNQMATGAALGGLASLLLGTSTGRGLAEEAAKLGGLAMIGGLAYQAYQNYQAGKPLINMGQPVVEAPAESPFGVTADKAQDHATALTIIRAMIAAAASDGIIDNEERSKIIGGLDAAGMDVHAAKFLDQEFAHPASISDLVAASGSHEIAIQIYTAARLAIHGDKPQEKAFLAALAQGLKLDSGLQAHIEASAVTAKGH